MTVHLLPSSVNCAEPLPVSGNYRRLEQRAPSISAYPSITTDRVIADNHGRAHTESYSAHFPSRKS